MQFRYFFIGKRFRGLFKGEVNNNCRIPLAGVMQISAFFRRFLHDLLDNGSFVGYICLVPSVFAYRRWRAFFSKRRLQCTAAHFPRRHFSNRRRPFSFREPIFPDSVFPIRSFRPCAPSSEVFTSARMLQDPWFAGTQFRVF